METKQFKKVDVNLLQTIMEVLAKSKTDLNFLQLQEIFKQIQQSENINDSDKNLEDDKVKSKE